MKRAPTPMERLRRNAEARKIRFLRWQARHLSQSTLMIIVSFVIGISAGLAATTLKCGVSSLSRLCHLGTDIFAVNWRYLWLPLFGILLTSFYQHRLCGYSFARGTYILGYDLLHRQYRLSPFTVFNPLIGCSLTMGMGASAGTEGPVALSAAAIGSNLGRWFGLSNSWLRIFVGVGAGAGIAAIFTAPVAGVLYSIEVLQMEITTFPLVGLIIACVTAAVTVFMLTGMSIDIPFDNSLVFEPRLMGWVVLFGFICGLYSIYYNYTKMTSFRLFSRIGNPLIAALATGGLLSIGVTMFPVLYGTGGGTMTDILNGRYFSFTAGGIFTVEWETLGWALTGAGAVLLLKGVLVAASYSGGGVAGEFVPTLFAGCVLGWLFGTGCNAWLGTELPPWFFALLGMGAVMGGCIHAPVMAFFVVVETTNTFSFIVAYFVVIVVAYVTVKVLTPKKYFNNGLNDLLALRIEKRTPDLYTPTFLDEG